MLPVAMIGLGWWGRKMTAVLGRSDKLRVVRAVDPDAAGAGAFAAEHGIPFGTDYQAALADADVRAVILATPHALHSAQIEQAVRAGKHVFCEKPLALTRVEAERSVRLCRNAGLVLGTGHERRFEPPMADLIARADAGALGRILQVEAQFSHDKFLALDPGNWRLQPEHAPAAGMTATGIHLTDLAIRLMGPATSVLVTCERLASKLAGGDTMSALVRFAGGGTAYVSASLATPFVSRFAAFGSSGWIEIRDRAHVEAPEGWVVTEGRAGEPITVREVGPAEPVGANLEAFARAVAGDAPYPITGEQLVGNIALLQAIIRGAQTGALEPVAHDADPIRSP
jgi:predicted dehydrogenase